MVMDRLRDSRYRVQQCRLDSKPCTLGIGEDSRGSAFPGLNGREAGVVKSPDFDPTVRHALTSVDASQNTVEQKETL